MFRGPPKKKTQWWRGLDQGLYVVSAAALTAAGAYSALPAAKSVSAAPRVLLASLPTADFDWEEAPHAADRALMDSARNRRHRGATYDGSSNSSSSRGHSSTRSSSSSRGRSSGRSRSSGCSSSRSSSRSSSSSSSPSNISSSTIKRKPHSAPASHASSSYASAASPLPLSSSSTSASLSDTPDADSLALMRVYRPP